MGQDPFLQKSEFKKLVQAIKSVDDILEIKNSGVLETALIGTKAMALLQAYLEVTPIIYEKEFLKNDIRKLYALKIGTDLTRFIEHMQVENLAYASYMIGKPALLHQAKESLEKIVAFETQIKQEFFDHVLKNEPEDTTTLNLSNLDINK